MSDQAKGFLDIKMADAAHFHMRLVPMSVYLLKAQQRVRDLGFPDDDRFRLEIEAATNAVCKLTSTTWIMTCGGGWGMPHMKEISEQLRKEREACQQDTNKP